MPETICEKTILFLTEGMQRIFLDDCDRKEEHKLNIFWQVIPHNQASYDVVIKYATLKGFSIFKISSVGFLTRLDQKK